MNQENRGTAIPFSSPIFGIDISKTRRVDAQGGVEYLSEDWDEGSVISS